MTVAFQRRFRRTRWQPLANVLVIAGCFATVGRVHFGAPPMVSTAHVGNTNPFETSNRTNEQDPCDDLKGDVMGKVWPVINRWETNCKSGGKVFWFGRKSSKLLNHTIAYFDEQVELRGLTQFESGCSPQRVVVEQALKQQLQSLFLLQRSTIEQDLYQRLKRDLLKRMQRRRREIDVSEKLLLLHSRLRDYDREVAPLVPAFVIDAERDRAEKRLSQLQWGVHELPEAKEMQKNWKNDRLRKLGSARQSSRWPPSISISHGMRFLVRPAGFGNLKVQSTRQMGPPHNPSEFAVSVFNDGNVVDVYNKAPRPPILKLQPAIGVDISFG